jgi:hypothetical protein
VKAELFQERARKGEKNGNGKAGGDSTPDLQRFRASLGHSRRTATRLRSITSAVIGTCRGITVLEAPAGA